MWKVPLFKLNFDECEEKAVAEVIRSGWLTMGEETQRFEQEFADFLGHGASAVAVSNGTAALHLALLALGLKSGDEVIVPSLTFIADVNSVVLCGAKPVLADCRSLRDWNVDPADIERKITSRTRAVMVVHYAGVPCDMDAITAICRTHGIALIEDCAHAPGATWNGQAVGTFGEFGCWSFFSNKNLSVGEGGMVTTTSDELATQVRYLRSHGMTTLTLDRHKGRAVTYDVVRPGLNYRIDEIRAALGRVQLRKLVDANLVRASVVEKYVAELSGIQGLVIPFPRQSNVVCSHHIFAVLLPSAVNRLEVIESLKQDGVQSSIHYPSIQHFSAYRDAGFEVTPVADEISRRELTLPLYPGMTVGDVDTVIDSVRRALSAVD